MLERIRHALLKKRRRQVAWWDFIEASEEQLQALEERGERLWGMRSSARRFDRDSGRLRFLRADGLVLEAEVQWIGLYRAAQQHWTWAWAQQDFPEVLTADARRLRAYGEKEGFERLTVPVLRATEIEAWGLVAAACALGWGQGAWRYETPAGSVFLIFKGLPDDKALPGAAVTPAISARGDVAAS
ncbi:MAG: DUF6882 domain-containing protein [Solimonas sp.]